MKRILAVAFVVLTLSGVALAKPAPATPHLPAPRSVWRTAGAVLARLLTHFTMNPLDGGHGFPPPGSPTPAPLDPTLSSVAVATAR